MGPGLQMKGPPPLLTGPFPALPRAGHSPPSHVKSPSLPSWREKCPAWSNAFLDTLSQDSVLWWVPCQSACKVNPISEQHMGRGSLPPPPEVWPLLCLLALPKGLSPRSSVFSATSDGGFSVFSALSSLGCWGVPLFNITFSVSSL